MEFSVIPGHFESYISRKFYVAVGTWILNGSSINYHEKKHQPFSFTGVQLVNIIYNLLAEIKTFCC